MRVISYLFHRCFPSVKRVIIGRLIYLADPPQPPSPPASRVVGISLFLRKVFLQKVNIFT